MVLASADSTQTWERTPGTAYAPLWGYHRREPEKTILHEVVRDRLETFLDAAHSRSPHGLGLPSFVECELRACLDCGILARGFARVRCPDCGFERLVAFIADQTVARKILDHLALDSTGPPLARPEFLSQVIDPGPDCSTADPLYPD